MDLDKIILQRHSIQDYQNKDVDHKLIAQILDISKNAPSSGNVQNWRFIIVKDQLKREKIARSCLNQLWMNQAPVHIVICYDDRNIKTLFPKHHKDYSIQNVSIVSTLIILKAAELKLGTCWISIPKPLEMSGLLKLPDYLIPHIVITLGYPKDTYKKTTRNSLDTMTYFEEYSHPRKHRNPSIFPLSKQKLSRIKSRIGRKKE